jgi:hypothetical protein
MSNHRPTVRIDTIKIIVEGLLIALLASRYRMFAVVPDLWNVSAAFHLRYKRELNVACGVS